MAAAKITGKQIQEAQLKQFKPSPKPPTDFDPLKATPEDLVKYGLPRRPLSGNEVAYTIWKAIVSEPSRVRPRSYTVPLSLILADYVLAFAREDYPGAQETSRNWSGAVTYAGGPFSQVSGMWQVPPVSAPPSAGKRSYRCSTWIGLDGHDPTSPSMPQVGVTMIVDTSPGLSTTRYEAWFQWWSRKYSSQYILKPYVINGFDIAPGDEIACAIDVIDTETVNVAIRNLTPPRANLFTQQVSGLLTLPLPPNPTVIQMGPVNGTTAEWIVERPTKYKHPKSRFKLPVFDEVTFVPATSAQPLGPARLIRMVEPDAGNPSRLAVLSRARKDYLPNGSPLVIAGPGLERAMGG
jgi:hypothetical protein